MANYLLYIWIFLRNLKFEIKLQKYAGLLYYFDQYVPISNHIFLIVYLKTKLLQTKIIKFVGSGYMLSKHCKLVTTFLKKKVPHLGTLKSHQIAGTSLDNPINSKRELHRVLHQAASWTFIATFQAFGR